MPPWFILWRLVSLVFTVSATLKKKKNWHSVFWCCTFYWPCSCFTGWSRESESYYWFWGEEGKEYHWRKWSRCYWHGRWWNSKTRAMSLFFYWFVVWLLVLFVLGIFMIPCPVSSKLLLFQYLHLLQLFWMIKLLWCDGSFDLLMLKLVWFT